MKVTVRVKVMKRVLRMGEGVRWKGLRGRQGMRDRQGLGDPQRVGQGVAGEHYGY